MDNAPDHPDADRPDEDRLDEAAPAGWNVLRVLGFILGLLVMTGFGFCSLCGLAIGAGSDAQILIQLILPGLLIAALGFALARWMYVRARRPKKL